jgi:hypothetical protein
VHERGFEDATAAVCLGLAALAMAIGALDIAEDFRVAFEPVAVEGLGDHPELDDEVAGEVLGLDVTSLLVPEAEQCGARNRWSP